MEIINSILDSLLMMSIMSAPFGIWLLFRDQRKNTLQIWEGFIKLAKANEKTNEGLALLNEQQTLMNRKMDLIHAQLNTTYAKQRISGGSDES